MVMVLIQFYQDDASAREGLLDFLLDRFPQITSLFYTINRKGNDTLYDLDLIC